MRRSLSFAGSKVVREERELGAYRREALGSGLGGGLAGHRTRLPASGHQAGPGHRLARVNRLIELFTDDYWTGDPDLQPLRWSVHEERRRSFWGHQVAERWYLESSEVVDLDGQPVQLVQPAIEEMKAAVLPR